MDYQFHQSQLSNAQKIYEAILNGHSYILFHLRMQGGKTGTYLKAALDLLHSPESTIDNVVIIGGFSDISLTSQLKQDVEKAIKYYSKQSYPHSVDDYQGLIDKLTMKIQIYTGKNVEKIPILNDNSIVIHDESHHASSKTNIPFNHFYKKHNIEKALCGDFTQLKKRNIHIVSIGATSFAEIISNKKVELGSFEDDEPQSPHIEEKIVIYGEVGEKYYGIFEYLRDKKIIFENDPEKILPQLEKSEGYVIIRTNSKKSNDLPSLALKYDMDYKSLTGGMGSEVFDFLETKPSKMTLVHICGLGRMGKVLCKTHIIAVIETSKKPQIDTILQGLPGRMCGYNIPDNIKIYVPSNTKLGFESYSRDELCLIDRAMNVKKHKSTSKHTIGDDTKDKSGKWWKRTVPIKILTKNIDFGPGETYKDINIHHVKNALDDHPELIATNPDKETLNSGRYVISVVRDSKGISYKGFSEKFDKASTNNTRECCNFTNLITHHHTDQILEKGSFGLFGNKDVVYLYGYIQTTKPIIPKLPTIKPKSNYFPTIQEDGETLNTNGGQIICFPNETSTNIELFKTELMSAIERTIKTNSNYIPNCESKISSIYDCGTKQHKGIFLDKTIFIKSKIKTIVDTFNKKYSINITLNKSKLILKDINRLFPTGKWYRYASISWTHTN